MPESFSAWNHPSVLALAGDRNPLETITEMARTVVAKALDRGWSGPPFDPFELAALQGINIVARNNVHDACIVAANSRGFRIEFNPSRPRGRLRYSIAHEIAHTLFPDCADQVRNRLHHQESVGESWQLESLCNVAAAEFLMPWGSFSVLREGSLEIDRMLELQREFAVSLEAVLIRTVRLTDSKCMAFTASRIESGREAGLYRLDYCVPSANCTIPVPLIGTMLKQSTRIAECTKIGFTTKGKERWPRWNTSQLLEGVALPPHPKSLYPRVAGIVRPLQEGESVRKITYLRGDATDPRTKPALVVQVVNDATPNWGGNGFAVAVRRRWPSVQSSFREFARKRGLQLGAVHVTEAVPGIWVASMVAQKGYRSSVRPKIRYAALWSALTKVAQDAERLNATLHMPRIGCGEGRGKWELISDLVRSECVCRGLSVVVYDLPTADGPKSGQDPPGSLFHTEH